MGDDLVVIGANHRDIHSNDRLVRRSDNIRDLLQSERPDFSIVYEGDVLNEEIIRFWWSDSPSFD